MKNNKSNNELPIEEDKENIDDDIIVDETIRKSSKEEWDKFVEGSLAYISKAFESANEQDKMEDMKNNKSHEKEKNHE